MLTLAEVGFPLNSSPKASGAFCVVPPPPPNTSLNGSSENPVFGEFELNGSAIKWEKHRIFRESKLSQKALTIDCAPFYALNANSCYTGHHLILSIVKLLQETLIIYDTCQFYLTKYTGSKILF